MPSRPRVRNRRWQATLIVTLVFTAAVGAAAVGWWYARESPPHQGPLILLAVVIILVEVNALVGPAAPASGGKKILATLSGTFWAGFILTAILYVVLAMLFG